MHTRDEVRFREEVLEFIRKYRRLAPAESDTRLKTPERQRWQQLLLKESSHTMAGCEAGR